MLLGLMMMVISMIIKGSQRSGAKQLAAHLLKTEENEHVEIHEVRGFYTTDKNIYNALHEIKTLSCATNCKQYMFSVSLNPPQDERAPIEYFEHAVSQIEDRLNLKDQPRIIVFHEKEGRRHAHCVWSRIDHQEMKAINLPHYKNRLNEISKDLFLKYDWSLPKGYTDRQYSNPLNFTLQEWQQAKRANEDTRVLKSLMKQAWERSDNKAAFMNALSEHGFTLARGERRGYVAVDYKGEIYSLSRWTGAKTKALKQKIGAPQDLPSVEQAKQALAEKMTPVLQQYIQDIHKQRSKNYKPLQNAIHTLKRQHQKERAQLDTAQNERRVDEERQRQNRLPRGIIKNILSRITGKYQRIQKQNAEETKQCFKRDNIERQKLVEKQLDTRQKLQERVHHVREDHNSISLQLRKDIGTYMEMKEKQPEAMFEFSGQKNDTEYYRTM